MYEDLNKCGSTVPGTIVTPIVRELSVYADSADEAEKQLRIDVQNKALPGGRVYQICPCLGTPELIRSVAASSDGTCQRVFLDPAAGLYSELRRIRLPRPTPTESTPEVATSISTEPRP
jgi:hypothetical protein